MKRHFVIFLLCPFFLYGCWSNRNQIELNKENSFGHEWMAVEAGSFEMGSNINANENEKPKHDVYLDFWKTCTLSDNVEIVRTSPLPSNFQTYNLNVADLTDALAGAPERFAHIDSELVISLPQADGALAHFQVYKSSVFSAISLS